MVNLDAWVVSDGVFDQIDSIVRATIVHDKDFDVRIRLIEQRPHTRKCERSHVVHGDDNAYQWVIDFGSHFATPSGEEFDRSATLANWA